MSSGGPLPSTPVKAQRGSARRRRTVALLAAAAIAAAVLVWILRSWSARAPGPPAEQAPPPVAVTTLAGNGTPGLANGSSSSALFADPFGVVVDSAGYTFVTDAGDNNLVRAIAPDGTVSVVAGGLEGWRDGTGPDAEFNTPSGIALAPDGTLVVADTGNHAIRRVTREGVVTTVAGGLGAGRDDGRVSAARFDGPIGVAVDGDGTIFVADTYNDLIRAISPEGDVRTVAGGAGPGFRDGTGGEARFDTPSGLALDNRGVLFVADTGNDVVRRVDRQGRVTTLGIGPNAPPSGSGVVLTRPVGIAALPDGDVCVSDAGGRVSVFSRDGRSRVLAGSSPGFADGDGPSARFSNPTGLAATAAGGLRVADSENYLVRAVTPRGEALPARDVFLSPLPLLSPEAIGFEQVPWPVDPQQGWHEVTATLGEARGSLGGDGRERLHAGIDVHAEPGTIVRAVHDEKVERPIAATAFGDLNESVRVALMAYVHVRVGRDRRDLSLDASRFVSLYDEFGVATRMRLRRGTRFRVGDPIGTANRFAHVHLGLGPHGAEVNLLRFALPEFGDHVPPTIAPDGVWLLDESGARIKPVRGRVDVSGRVAIVVDAWDQVDRNRRTRRLGVYRLGYQVLRADGRPLPGFEHPLVRLQFDRLPQRSGAGEVAYAAGSGITVYGSRATHFRYVVTNEVIGGEVSQGWWDTSGMAPGDYRLRVVAEDISGNKAAREVRVRVTAPSAPR